MRNVAGLTLRGMTGAAVEVEAEITGGMPAFAVVGPARHGGQGGSRARARGAAHRERPAARARLGQPRAGRPAQGGRYARPADSRSPRRKGGRVRDGAPALYIGELALDGRLRGVRGAVPAAFFARENGMELFVPPENAAEVSIVEGVRA